MLSIIGLVCSPSLLVDASLEPLLVFVNVLVIDDGLTEFAQGARFDGPEDAVGESHTAVNELFEEKILSEISDIYQQCNVLFALKTTRVIRPDRFISPLQSEKAMADLFSEVDGNTVLEMRQRPSVLDSLSLYTIVRAEKPDVLVLFREGPYLNLFVTGAPLMQSEGASILAQGQVNGRHSVVTLRDFEQINTSTSIETIAHEWGHNFGMMHTDKDGLPETDNDPINLMNMAVNPSGEGNRRLTQAQCAIARSSPLLQPSPSSRADVLKVPEEFSSIHEAIGAAAPGATVQVATGIYHEPILIDKPIKLIAGESAQVVLDRPDTDNLPTLLINNAADVEIRGFTILGDGVVVLNSVDISLQDNDIVHSRSHGLYVRNARVRIERNTIKDCSLKGMLLFYVRNSLFRQNTITGSLGQFGAGIVMSRSTDVRIHENTINENLEGIVFLMGNSDVEIIGNVIQDNEDHGISLWPFDDPLTVLQACSDNTITGNRVDYSIEVPETCLASGK